MILHFIQSKHENQKRPVAKTKEGKLAVINGASKNALKVKLGEDWQCELVDEKPNFVIINPIKKIIEKQVKENPDLLNKKIAELKQKWGAK